MPAVRPGVSTSPPTSHQRRPPDTRGRRKPLESAASSLAAVCRFDAIPPAHRLLGSGGGGATPGRSARHGSFAAPFETAGVSRSLALWAARLRTCCCRLPHWKRAPIFILGPFIHLQPHV